MKTAELEKRVSQQPGMQPFLFICILLVGLHSVCLGLFIYFFTDVFYQLFFSTMAENVFFVRQSGVLLFCLGACYLLPLLDFERLSNVVAFTVFSKCVAVLFLAANAELTLSPAAIYAAALADGIMAAILVIGLYSHRRTAGYRNRG